MYHPWHNFCTYYHDKLYNFCIDFQQSSLGNTEEECSHLKEMCEASQEELQHLAEKHEEQLKEVEQLQNKLEVRILIIII